jgi:hypothetical protein
MPSIILKAKTWYSPSSQKELTYYELDKNFLFFQEKPFAAFLDRAVLTERHFFNPDRVQTAEKQKIQTHISNGFYSDDENNTESISLIEGASTRVFIAALTAVLNQTENALSPETKQLFHPLRDNIAWKKNAKHKFLSNYYSFGGVEFSVTPNPAPGHLGNVFLHGIGAYDKEKPDSNSILSILASLTDGNPEKEREVAQMLKDHLRDGTPFEASLFEKKGAAQDRWYKRMNGLLLLIGVFEITRRGFTEHLIINSKSPEERHIPFRPFAIGLSKALDLVADGHLRMKDVFGFDAPYGMSTTRGLNSPTGIEKSFQKLEEIHRLYAEKYYPAQLDENALERYKILTSRFTQGGIVPRSEVLHQELRMNFGGKGSPNRPYQSRNPTPNCSPTTIKRSREVLGDIHNLAFHHENALKKLRYDSEDSKENNDSATQKMVLRSISFQMLRDKQIAGAPDSGSTVKRHLRY